VRGGEAVRAGEPGGADGTVPRAAVLQALDGLVGKSILTVQPSPGGALRSPEGTLPGPLARTPQGTSDTATRYRMLETVRAYCLERLAEAGEEAAVKDAFARYYLDLAETADPLLRTREQVRWYHALTAEQDNLHAALRWAIGRGDADTALRSVRALSFYWGAPRARRGRRACP
jgi:hypothetical protein